MFFVKPNHCSNCDKELDVLNVCQSCIKAHETNDGLLLLDLCVAVSIIISLCSAMVLHIFAIFQCNDVECVSQVLLEEIIIAILIVFFYSLYLPQFNKLLKILQNIHLYHLALVRNELEKRHQEYDADDSSREVDNDIDEDMEDFDEKDVETANVIDDFDEKDVETTNVIDDTSVENEDHLTVDDQHQEKTQTDTQNQPQDKTQTIIQNQPQDKTQTNTQNQPVIKLTYEELKYEDDISPKEQSNLDEDDFVEILSEKSEKSVKSVKFTSDTQSNEKSRLVPRIKKELSPEEQFHQYVLEGLQSDLNLPTNNYAKKEIKILTEEEKEQIYNKIRHTSADPNRAKIEESVMLRVKEIRKETNDADDIPEILLNPENPGPGTVAIDKDLNEIVIPKVK